jgi:predicted esterase
MSFAQVMDPSDPVVEYSGSVSQPVAGQVKDWVKTTRLNWNTSEYKAYIYKGHIFRLKFPKSYQHNVSDGKTYPLFIFFHGIGEAADENLYDNEYQLLHGGQKHMNAVNADKFDGFLLYMQNQYGFFGNAHYDALAELIRNFLVPQNKVDINRILVDGLSGGGGASWDFTLRYPTLVAGALPISNGGSATTRSSTNVNIFKFIPIWHFQGGRDKNPSPGISKLLGDAILNVGGSYKYTEYPTLGHGCWDAAWAEPDFYPFMLRAHKANAVPLFGKYEFCVGENVNVTLGLSAGFDGYQWRKNGVVIPGATSNTYLVQGTQAAAFGTYDCRILRGSNWSVWSPIPVVVKLKDPTIPPAITTSGLMSKVIPAPDGNTGVTLKQPEGYVTYSWTRQGNATVLSTSDSLNVTTAGTYLVKVTEKFGCISEFSPPFTVINANGPNKPDAAKNLIVTPLSLTQIKVDWSDNPNPDFNETNFEVYQAVQAGGPYTLVGITEQDITSFTVNGLKGSQRYFFIVRAVNNTGASAISPEVSGTTVPDNTAPTAPQNLFITTATSNSAGLKWTASTDNEGIFMYDIYINGVASYVTASTSFTCYNLSPTTQYTFTVKARDAAGNASEASNPAFGGSVADIPANTAPSNVAATPVSQTKISLSWTDNSPNETGFQIFRSTNPVSGFAGVAELPANTTSFIDSIGLSPATLYYYRVSAVYPFGASYNMGNADANWKFNNDYIDASVNNKTIGQSGSPVFNAADKQEGTHAINFNGTNQYFTLNTAADDYTRGAYAQKTIAFWMKSNNNTGNRVIVDIGGNDDGLSLRLDQSRLYAGIASNNTRRNFYVNYSSTAWNHIALVYNIFELRLYVNGVLAGSNTNLGFTSLGTTSNGSRIGTVNSSNAFNTGTGYFSGLIDDFGIYSQAATPGDVLNLMNGTAAASATTIASPLVPAAPSNLLANGSSFSSNIITWTDNAANETGFKLYKSDDNNLDYILLATLPANATSFTDNNLYANSTRYYKLLAYNLGGNSEYSNEDSAKTWAQLPLVTQISNKYMRVGSQLQVSVHAESPLNGPITLNVSNLPAFGSFVSNGGNGTITFNNPTDLATYSDITVTATDPFGVGTASFQLVVNDNYAPELSAISNVAVNEGQASVVNLAATDQNADDVLTWSFTGLPSFVTVNGTGNSRELSIAPGYADHGTYPVTVLVQDDDNGSSANSFSIVVSDINPNQRIYVNFNGPGSAVAPAPWNSTNDMPGLNDTYANFKDQTGATTPITLKVMSAWGSIGNGSNALGANTGNNSGVFPDAVISTAFWTDVNNVQRMKIYGLDSTQKYTFTFFGSRGNVADNRTSIYTLIGADSNSVSLNAANNSQNTVVIQNAQPRKDTFDLKLGKGVGSSFAYLNAMVIERVFTDNTAPAKPRNLAAQLVGTTAKLTWIDAAFNETDYFIYRSTEREGTYTLLNNQGNNPNIQAYDDATVSGNETYYYSVKAQNANGEAYSDTVSVETGNGTPIMTAITNVTMRIQETVNVPVTVTDDLGDVIVLTASNLPAFASLIDNGDGTGTVHVAPGSSVGIFNNVTIRATDDKGAFTERTFRIMVRDIFNSVYVNFSNVVNPAAPSPWNSFTSVPFAGKKLTNMIDDSETPTSISITQVTSWEGANNLGAISGDNSGVFPDVVMQTVYYQSSGVPMTVKIEGLNTVNTKYNLVFFASRLAGDNRNTVYAANGDSVTLNAANNTTNTVQLNGLVPDANGVIEFSCLKGEGSPFAYLGAVVIQSYVDDGTPSSPSNLATTAKSKTTIDLTWTDKSSDEDGFEIERAESYAGPFTLIHTTGQNADSYSDASGLVADKVYYYRVRAVKAGVYSGYSNISGTSTYIYSVYINFNRQNNAGSPWNNTARAPELGRVFSNLRNDLGNSSGINMTIVENFNGDNPDGMNTGNNSGIYPDNVLRSSWWVDAGFSATLKFSNLNQNLNYSFVFLGSRNGAGERTSVYTIDGKSVSLNAAFNTTKTVQLNNVRPDENGEVYLTVSLAQYAMFAYLNSCVINGYRNGEVPPSIPSEGRMANPMIVDAGGSNAVDLTGARTTGTVASASRSTAVAAVPEAAPAVGKVAAYPNPFKDQITVATQFDKAQEKVLVRLVDMSGKVLYSQYVVNVPQGVWNYRLDLSGKSLKRGVYLLQVAGSADTKRPAVFKLVKD